MTRACADADLDTADIDCIHAGGCGIPARDIPEINTLAELFGDRATPVTTSAALTGNMLAAAGAFSTATAALSLHAGTIPPAHVIPAAPAGLTWSPHAATREIRHALVSTCGITGEHAALILRGHTPAAADTGVV
jgi:act minimal PKS chain-length factor (CLF/KS beta)